MICMDLKIWPKPYYSSSENSCSENSAGVCARFCFFEMGFSALVICANISDVVLRIADNVWYTAGSKPGMVIAYAPTMNPIDTYVTSVNMVSE